MEKQEIRIFYYYEYKLGHDASEASRNINKVWGENASNERTIRRWFKKFRSGDMSLEDEEGRGPTSKLDNDQLKSLVEANPRTTIRELATELGVSKSTVERHLTEIGKVKKLDKWIPHNLNEKQKHRRYEISFSYLLRNNNDPFLDRIITCDEKWVFYDNQRRTGQWLDKDESPRHFPKPELHPKKVMVTVWWTAAGIIHYYFLERGKTITAIQYSNELNTVHQKLSEKYPALVNRKGPILLQDNAKPHIAKITLEKLKELGYEILPHPPYSPDLAPTDYHFFKHMDNFLQEKIYPNQATLENDVKAFIDSRTPEFFKIGIESLVKRWEKCVLADGDYFD